MDKREKAIEELKWSLKTGCVDEIGVIVPQDTVSDVLALLQEHPEPVYPTWWQWLADNGVVDVARIPDGCYGAIITKIEPSGKMYEHIPADIAEKLGIEPKEG